MPANLQIQPQIKILPTFRVREQSRLREADIDDVVKTVTDVLPQHCDRNVDISITLLEKNLKIMADMALMKQTLAQLVRNTMEPRPGCGKFPLTINQVNFQIESLLQGDDSIIGACAFMSLAGASKYISFDEKIKEKILEPFFTTKTDDNGVRLAIAYRIVKQHYGKTKIGSRVGQGTEVNIYLPLTRLELVSMMSIPVG